MPDGPPDRREYFISYNSADREFALALSRAFDANGITHHIDRKGLQPGQSVGGWMEASVDSYVRMIGLCSPDYFRPGAEYSAAERAAAFWTDAAGREGRFVPVIVRDCTLPELYGPLLRIDVAHLPMAEAVAETLAQLRAPEGSMRHEQQRRALAHPDIFNVPRPRLASFTGHHDKLQDAHATLSQGQDAGTVQIFCGMGGVGKSTLAAEYAHRFGTRGRYGGVWWIDVTGGVADRLAELVRRAPPGLVVAEALPVPDQARAAREWLGTQEPPWLVIFDDARDPPSVRDWLPAGSARVIITSRWTDWSGLAQGTPISTWDVATTAEYLLAATGRTSLEDARHLAEKLDGLPLAADQAAAFLRDERTATFTDYADDLAELIDETSAEGAFDSAERTVYGTLTRSIAALDRAVQDLLCLIAWLSPDGVRLSTLTDAAREKPDLFPDPLSRALRDRYPMRKAVRPAERRALIATADTGSDVVLVTHRIVQTALRRWQRLNDRPGWDVRAANLVGTLFPYQLDDTATWQRAASLVPQVLALAEAGPATDPAGAGRLGYLLSQAGAFRQFRGDVEGAIELMRPGAEFSRIAYGPDSRQYLISLSNLAVQLIETGDLEAAERDLNYVLDRERRADPPDPSITATLNNLAAVHIQRQNFPAAEPLLEEALAISRAVHGEDAVGTSDCLNGLGTLYDEWADQPGQEWRRARVEELHLDSLAALRASRGERHPSVANRHHNLAVLYARRDNMPDAIAAALRGAAILLSLHLPGHRELVDIVSRLYEFWDRIGQSGRQENLLAEIAPVIDAVEQDMRAWVDQAPGTRQFGPPSFFDGKPELLAAVRRVRGTD